ncbi:cyclic-di-AMP receptor [Hathewaya histolytica]|uniref:cyclic-di-AMP receptor n=1 Tax=Hathewaya histolytica TaxID=1498 RepID=UPI003B6764AC
MKLIITIVQDRDANSLISELTERKYGVTKLASTGGFLKSGNTTLMIGIEDDKVNHVIDIIKETCNKREEIIVPVQPVSDIGAFYSSEPIKVNVGGATVFVVNVDKFVKK